MGFHNFQLSPSVQGISPTETPLPIPLFEKRFFRTRAGAGRGFAGFLRFRPPLPRHSLFAALVNLLVTADAQALQVVLIMGATISQRFDVMHQLGRSEFALTLALFTERMAADVAVPYLSPNLIVSLVVIIATSKMFVVLLHHLSVLFAVTAFVVCQPWAATEPAGALWFHGHGIHLRP